VQADAKQRYSREDFSSGIQVYSPSSGGGVLSP
jgi:hypothetical protein